MLAEDALSKYIWAKTSSVHFALNPSPRLYLTTLLLCGAVMAKLLCGLKYTFTHHRGLFPVGRVNKWLWLSGTLSPGGHGWIHSAHSVIKGVQDQYGVWHDILSFRICQAFVQLAPPSDSSVLYNSAHPDIFLPVTLTQAQPQPGTKPPRDSVREVYPVALCRLPLINKWRH